MKISRNRIKRCKWFKYRNLKSLRIKSTMLRRIQFILKDMGKSFRLMESLLSVF